MIEGMILYELFVLAQKPETAADTLSKIPEYMAAYLDSYDFQHVKAEFPVFVRDGSLTIHNPLKNWDVELPPPDAQGRWKDEYNKNEITFVKDANGIIKMMKIDSINHFHKEN